MNMRATKYIHSCLLLEEGGEKLLFDPGRFTFLEGLVTPDQFRDVHWIVITHTHPDHLETDAVRKIIEVSGAFVIGNHEVSEALHAEALAVCVLENEEKTFGAFRLRAIPAKHQPILWDTLPQNTAFVVNKKLLNGGDSFDPALDAYRGIDTLALPVLAPYLTELDVMDYAKRLQPKQAIPLHDGYAKDFFIEQRHANYAPYFEKLGIQFHKLARPGDSVEL
jgi:L-ascorbate metabolism protein UlaG (beta-lactamase superfamily)